MKKLFSLSFYIILAFSSITRGDNGATIKSGWNLSSFVNDDFHLKPGVNWGVEREITIKGRFSISWELAFVSRGGVLKDKLIGGNPEYSSGYGRYTLVCSIGFFDLPVLLHFYWPKSHSIRWHFYLGPSLSVGAHDNSERWQTEHFDYDPYNPNSKWPRLDYGWTDDVEDETLSNSTFCAHVGCGAKWRQYHFELRYSYPFTGLGSVDGVWLGNKMYHTLSFIVGVWLPDKSK